LIYYLNEVLGIFSHDQRLRGEPYSRATAISNARASPPVLLDDLSHSDDDVADVSLGHLWVNGQRDNTLESCACGREVLRFVPEFVAVVGMKMQRDEMDRSADLLFSQRLDELVAIDFEILQIQLNYKKMPCMLDIVPAEGNLDFLEICEGFCVIHCDALSG